MAEDHGDDGRSSPLPVPCCPAAYVMLRDGVEYRDLGHQDFAQGDKEQVTLLQRLGDLGVVVEVKAA